MTFDEIPFELLFLIFLKSSNAPNIPNEKVIKINNQLYGLFKSAQRKTPVNNPIKIRTPPIVGVPIFFIRCSSGPSDLIGLVIFLFEKYLINFSPIKNTTTIAVITAKPVLTVKKLKKFKKV